MRNIVLDLDVVESENKSPTW